MGGRRRDRRHVALWVTQGNEPAQRFYESLGFVVVAGHQPLASDPCKDEIRMALELDPEAATTQQ